MNMFDCLAYVGPGAGLSMIGALLAVVCVIGLALIGPILYPIRMFRRWAKSRNNVPATEE
ncbi:MAG: hypothetical protein ACK5PB_19585 [Pirellula sp.]|jgi:hypothetical protein